MAKNNILREMFHSEFKHLLYIILNGRDPRKWLKWSGSSKSFIEIELCKIQNFNIQNGLNIQNKEMILGLR